MSGAISSSSSAFLLLVASSSPRRRRGRVGAALRSHGYSGPAELRLHCWARRGPSRDGAAVVRAAAAPAGDDGEDAAASAESYSSKGVAVQGTKTKVDYFVEHLNFFPRKIVLRAPCSL